MRKLLFTLFSCVLLLSCSNKEDSELELISFPNMQKVVADDGDEVLLELSSILTITDYQLFINNNEIIYSAYDNGILFEAAYTDGKDGDIYLKHKQSGSIVKGPQLLVRRSYSYFFYSDVNIAYTSGSLYLDDEGCTYGSFQISDEIYFKRACYDKTIEGRPFYAIDNEYITTKVPEIDPALMASYPYLDGRDDVDRRGFTKYGNKIYTYVLHVERKNYRNLLHLIFEYDIVKKTFYPYNVIDGDGGIAKADMDGFTTDIRVDSKGTLYALCVDIPGIYKLDKQKGNYVFAGSKIESGDKNGVGSEARFKDIVMFKVDKKDNIYVAEKNRIRMITPDGTVSTLAGDTKAGDRTGAISDALFTDIMGIAVAPDNSIYILEKDKKELKIINAERTEVSKFKIKTSSTSLFSNKQYAVEMEVNKNGVVELCVYSYNSERYKAYFLASIMPNDFIRSDDGE